MVWSYDSTAPTASDKSWVRLRIGDTSSGSPMLQDEEIEGLLGEEGNKHFAAAVAAESIGGGFARRSDTTVGKLRISLAKASESYFRLADRLRIEANMRVTPYAGGISVADIETQNKDTDQLGASFEIGMMDFPGTKLNERSC